ncbi:MAG: CoA-binding protein [Spirochaetota bacterium]|nr:CoA-binding protein [Spirochaetota bacterium]
MNNEIITTLNAIFYPKTLAVIGASNREGNFGLMFTRGFIEMGFKRLYIVHPKEEDVLGINAYPRVVDIPDEIDLAVVTTPLKTVTQVIRECVDKGVKGVIIFTSGFREYSPEGKVHENEILNIARQGKMRIIGPNCMGIYCPASRLSIFSGMPKDGGSVGMISHSGSLSMMLTLAMIRYGIGFSKVVSCGNECDLNAIDFLEYYGQDTDTKIIIAYLESIKDGARFCRLAKDITKKKPIIIWKGGTTERGAMAASSHTGAMAISGDIWRAVVNQSGIIPAQSIEDIVDYLQTFYYLPLPNGNRVVIISGPGGPAVGTTDACIDAGLELAKISSDTQKRISETIPSVGTSIKNPIDLGMGSGFFPEWYTKSIKALVEDDSVDILLLIGSRLDNSFCEEVSNLVKKSGKPVALITMPGLDEMSRHNKPVDGLAIYSDGRRAAMALGKLVSYAASLEKINTYSRKHS